MNFVESKKHHSRHKYTNTVYAPFRFNVFFSRAKTLIFNSRWTNARSLFSIAASFSSNIKCYKTQRKKHNRAGKIFSFIVRCCFFILSKCWNTKRKCMRSWNSIQTHLFQFFCVQFVFFILLNESTSLVK